MKLFFLSLTILCLKFCNADDENIYLLKSDLNESCLLFRKIIPNCKNYKFKDGICQFKISTVTSETSPPTRKIQKFRVKRKFSGGARGSSAARASSRVKINSGTKSGSFSSSSSIFDSRSSSNSAGIKSGGSGAFNFNLDGAGNDLGENRRRGGKHSKAKIYVFIAFFIYIALCICICDCFI